MASNNYKDPFKKLLANIKASAKPSPRSIITAEGKKLQGVEVNGIQKIVAIDAEDLKRKFDEQEGFCFWTGIPLNMDYINESYHKKNWYKKFDKYWKVSENDSKKILKNLIENKIKDYGTSRDIPSIEGTSKLSPYIKHGQIHVGSIWKKCSEIKSKGIGSVSYTHLTLPTKRIV